MRTAGHTLPNRFDSPFFLRRVASLRLATTLCSRAEGPLTGRSRSPFASRRSRRSRLAPLAWSEGPKVPRYSQKPGLKRPLTRLRFVRGLATIFLPPHRDSHTLPNRFARRFTRSLIHRQSEALTSMHSFHSRRPRTSRALRAHGSCLPVRSAALAPLAPSGAPARHRLQNRTEF